MNDRPLLPRLALVGVTLLWGSTFVVIQSALDGLSPFVLVATRFGLAAVALALLRPALLKNIRSALPLSLPLAVATLAGFGLQSMGLQSTTPARSAFITALSVVMVPGVYWLYTRRIPQPLILAALGLATGGILLLFWPLSLEWGRGDTLTFLSALAFAWYIVELGRASRRLGAGTLVFVQCLLIGLMAGGLAPLVETPRLVLSAATVGAIVYLGLACTVLTFLLMTWGQARIEATEAAIIYTLEPVVAATISVGIGREPLTLKALVGGGLIAAAMLLAGLKLGTKGTPGSS